VQTHRGEKKDIGGGAEPGVSTRAGSDEREAASGLRRLRLRARACNPGPLVPWATCAMAAGLWIGCAWTGAAAGAVHVVVPHADELRTALVAGALLAGLAVVVLGAVRMRARDPEAEVAIVDVWPVLVLVLIGAG
jgi:hypothetical protein